MKHAPCWTSFFKSNRRVAKFEKTMTAELINLKLQRKRKLREKKEIVTEANRVKFGRSKVEKSITSIENNRATKILDGKNAKNDGQRP